VTRLWGGSATSKDLMSAADYLKLFMLIGIAVGLVLNRRLAYSSVALRLENERFAEETDRMFGVKN
jgi:hypothetical protein